MNSTTEPVCLLSAVGLQLKSSSQQDRITLIGREIYTQIGVAMSNNPKNAVRVEDLLSVCASLVGFSIQIAVSLEIISGLDRPLISVTTSDNETFKAGTPLLDYIFNGELAIWNMIMGAVEQIGRSETLINFSIDELIAHSASTIGRDTVEIRVDEKNKPKHTPYQNIEWFWPYIENNLKSLSDNPREWPSIITIALQHAIIESKQILNTDIATTISIETVLAASKYTS